MATQPVNLQNHPAFTGEKVSHQQSGKTNTSHNEVACGFDKQVLCYKSEGHWFDSSWCQWIFH